MSDKISYPESLAAGRDERRGRKMTTTDTIYAGPGFPGFDDISVEIEDVYNGPEIEAVYAGPDPDFIEEAPVTPEDRPSKPGNQEKKQGLLRKMFK